MAEAHASRSKRGLRLPLVRRPDPVLTEDELDFIVERLDGYVAWADAEMAKHLVSESVIRGRITALDALGKLREALRR